jgi:pentatricopeptide repeat protein
MLGQGIEPDTVSFLVVMCACSRKGLFHESKTYFEAMTEDYGMVPTIRHHSCIVDLLGRTGEVDKAVEMIKKMPFCPNLVIWHTVLGASRYWGSSSIGKQAFQEAVHLDKNDAVAYIMISHIIASMEIEHCQPNQELYSTRNKDS